MKELAPRKSTIISLWPKIGFQSNRMHGYFEMPPCPPCVEHQRAPCKACRQYSVLKVPRVFDLEDIGEKKSRKEWIDDRELATDLASGVANHGVLAIDGDTPTAEELDEAFANLESYFQHTLELEDKVWSVNRRHYNVEHAMIAAAYFGVEREWLADTRPKKPCPSCGMQNIPNAIRCAAPTCAWILDWEKARDGGVLTEYQVKVGLAKGYLKPLAFEQAELEPVAAAAAPSKGKTKPNQGEF